MVELKTRSESLFAGAYLVPKSPAAVILSPLLTAENPASVNPQSVMIARWPGLFIHQVTAVAGVPAEPVPQKTTSPRWRTTCSRRP